MSENKSENLMNKGKAAVQNTKAYQAIRRKNRREWQEYFQTNITKFYNLLTDDGEKALLTGVVCGILGVFLFKEIVILAFLLLLAAGVIWMIADEAPVEQKDTDSGKVE